MMETKIIMRAVRLAVSASSYLKSGRPIDEHQLPHIESAKALLEQMRAIDLVDAVAQINASGLPMEINISAPVGRDEERSPVRQTVFQEKRIFHTKKSGGQP